MLSHLLFISALVCLGFANPLEHDEEATNKIIAGRNVTIYEFPWQVALLQAGKTQCGGALISRNTILTAASCLLFRYIDQVRIGSTYRGRGGYTRRVHRLVPHPDFNVSNMDNDIGVIILRNPVYYSRRVQPVTLPRYLEDLAINATVTVSGWGWINYEDGIYPDVLQAADVQVMDQETCSNAYRWVDVTENVMCARYNNVDGVGPCYGDYGGPAVDRSGIGNHPVIHGVYWGAQCSNPGFIAAYTRVSRYVEWIRSIK